MNEYSRSGNADKAIVKASFPPDFSDQLGGVFGPARVWFCQVLSQGGLCVLPEGRDLRRFFADAETFGLAVEVFPNSYLEDEQGPEYRQQLRVQHLLEKKEKIWVICLPEALEVKVQKSQEQVSWEVGGCSPLRKELLDLLHEEKFERVDRVESPGEMSPRGGLVDVWWPGQEVPWRFDYFGDDLENINSFDPLTQRRQKALKKVSWTKRGDALLPWTDLLPEDFPVVWMDQSPQEDKVPDNRHVVAHSFGDPRWITKSVDALEGKFLDRLERLKKISSQAEVHLFFDTDEGRHSFFKQADSILQASNITSHLGRLSEGLTFGDSTYINAHLLFGKTPVRQSSTFPKNDDATLLVDLKHGDLVVHIQHGIARYLGNKMIKKGEVESEFMALEFMNRSVLYVPATQMDQVQRYVGAGGATPRLHQLGGKQWNKQKEKISLALNGLARELLDNQVRRQHSQGVAYPPYDKVQQEFAAAFPHEETPDQIQVLHELEKDMTQSQPMDRLLCGDVGYGKTELALRAAYKAVLGGKQVAILVPTTVLASQHFRTFKERLEPFAVSVACLSRLVTGKEIKKIKTSLESGALDVLIGTHRLLSQDVQFLDLGLIVVDEEQRFGVAHKEALKSWRIGADILTLTATPIPRTMHMAMLGLRDISTLSTAPVDRQAVGTQVLPFNDEMMKRAMERELKRGGQVFVLHNRVNSLPARAASIRDMIPGARVEFANGRMTGPELEAIMLRVLNHHIDILVCTTIISNGIDISNVNTLIVENSHRFGLAELHQLRGRVGRADRRGYAYFFLPPQGKINREAKRRLHAMEEYSDLGAGFHIAMRDLEIRGAGNILGAEQSGQIGAVGYELYCQLLEESVATLKGEEKRRLEPVSVDLPIAAYLPEDWMGSRKEKITALRRLIKAKDLAEIKKLEEEFLDRFGTFPLPFNNLLEVLKLKNVLAALNVFSVSLTHDGLSLRFRQLKDLQEKLKGYPGSRRIEGDKVYLKPYQKKDGIGHVQLLLRWLNPENPKKDTFER